MQRNVFLFFCLFVCVRSDIRHVYVRHVYAQVCIVCMYVLLPPPFCSPGRGGEKERGEER